MKRGLLCKLCMTGMAMGFLLTVNARTWRVNNNTGVNANFTQLSVAVAHASVSTGDTLYVEGSTTLYTSFELKKRLVIIGPGYFLSGASANAGLQFHGNNATASSFYIDSLGSGSVIMGMSGAFYLDSRADDITISRCYGTFAGYNSVAGAKASNIRMTKNCISIDSSPAFENLECTNNLIYNFCVLNNTDNNNILFRNNVTIFTTPNISNAYISNNIFIGPLAFSNSTVRYNIATSNTLPAGNNNINNIGVVQLFINTGSSDGMYRLATGSPAIGAGEPINGVTPDCGAFGTSDPYRLSGIPPIPTIYALTVPASVPSSASSMTVTVSTRSNN